MNTRKLIIALAIVLPLAMPAISNANEEFGWHHGNRVERLTKELNLTDDQKAKLEDIVKQQKEIFKAQHEANHKQIEAILTQEQIQKWDELKKQGHEKWQKRHQGSIGDKPAQ